MPRATTRRTVPPAPRPWPREAGWLVPGREEGVAGANCTWLEYLIVRRSGRDDGILEQPIGSNRGTRIDTYAMRAGSPLGSWWCALWLGAVWQDCGAQVPAGYAAVDAWLPWMPSAPAVSMPTPGAAVVYGPSRRDGTHIGLVTRVGTGIRSPQGYQALTREGNRGYAGSATNNGITIDQAPLTRADVLGFVRPEPVSGWDLVTYAPADFLAEHLADLPPGVRARALEKIRDVVLASPSGVP